MPEINQATIRALVSVIPEDQLRESLVALLSGQAASAAPQATKIGSWPRGRPRKPGNGSAANAEARRLAFNAKRRAKRAAARAARAATAAAKPEIAPAPPKRRGGRRSKAAIRNGAATDPATTFWKHAEALAPTKPWVIVSKELGVNTALALDAFRSMKLPLGLNEAAAEKFLALPAS